MRRFPSWVYLASGVASMLFLPSIYAVRFYVAAERLVAKSPEIESILAASNRGMAGKSLVCLRRGTAGNGVTPGDIERLHGPIFDAKNELADGLPDAFYVVLGLGLDLARGVRELAEARSELAQYVGSVDPYEAFCEMPAHLLAELEAEAGAGEVPVVITRAEEEGEAKLWAHAARLEEFRLQFVRARATHDARKLLFRAIAWADILLEVVGMFCTAMIIRASLRERGGGAG
jgi:hypothetical protein